jgi:hypothetical protein
MPDGVTGAGGTRPVGENSIPNEKPQKDPGEKSGWEKVFGAVLGGAANILVPNGGSILGTIIRRSQDTEQVNQYNRLIDTQGRQMANLVNVQMRVQDQGLTMNMITNLLKSKHDGQMAAVQNMKS